MLIQRQVTALGVVHAGGTRRVVPLRWLLAHVHRTVRDRRKHAVSALLEINRVIAPE